MLKTEKEIISFLSQYNIENFTINSDFSVDVQGHVDLSIKQKETYWLNYTDTEDRWNAYQHYEDDENEYITSYSLKNNKPLDKVERISLSYLPIQFNTVTGDFNISNNKLTSLKGCPVSVGGFFNCSNNLLTTLQHCPNNIGYKFNCDGNKINTLLYFPEHISKDNKNITACSLKNNKLGIFNNSTNLGELLTEHLKQKSKHDLNTLQNKYKTTTETSNTSTKKRKL